MQLDGARRAGHGLSIYLILYIYKDKSIYLLHGLSIYPIVQYGHALNNIQTDNIAVTHRNGNYEGLQRNSC